MKKAIYALSADPITKGHLSLIERASKMFDQLVVAIGNNDKKKYLFTSEERLSITEQSLKTLDLSGCDVHAAVFSGSLANFAFENDINVVVRGIRNAKDFQEEQDLANINKTLNNGLETCFILTEANQSSVSSSAAKEIIRNGHFADDFLTLHSKSKLQNKINNQRFIGITGLMGSGKSFISEQLDKMSEGMSDIRIHNLDLDLLCNEVYDLDNLKFEKQRKMIIDIFGSLDKRMISDTIFSSKVHLDLLNDIFKPVIEYQVQKHSENKKGIILINGATIVSMGFLSSLCNNNILMVKSDIKTRYNRCNEKRNIPNEIIEKRDQSMLSYEEQEAMILKKITKDKFGFLKTIENNGNKINFKTLINEIIEKTN